ncbi:hypothetical protein OG871_25850 [Kitasatospora sp. NBC_00374]|uniref:hypothetical protein n=1 Tax=Kitasatospora sp. NBC_00374 TaxID=2975964 RepID=UPI00324BA1BB
MATPVITGERASARTAAPGTAPRPVSTAALRRAVDTPPGRLRLAGAVLAALVLLFGAVTAWQAGSRATASGHVAGRSGPLSQDAAEIYRSLADADTTAASGFLLAGAEPAAVRKRYQDDLATASRLLAEASARAGADADAQRWISELNQQVPQYAGLVETARANDRQGLPLGGAYLRYASTLMQDTMLANAQHLVDAESRQLDGDYADAESLPWAALALGLLALGALARYQLVLFRRTNRVFNPGLVTASATLLVAVLWLLIGSLSAGSWLADSRTYGTEPLMALNQARTQALQAHTAENLNLVARGSSDTYTKRWAAVTDALAGPAGQDGAARDGGSLAQALRLAPRDASDRVAEARKQFTGWDARHRQAAEKEGAGDFDAALQGTVGAGRDDTAEASFAALDQQLGRAATVERARFKAEADGVDGTLEALAVGAAVLAVLSAVAVVRGIGRRLADYR